MAVCMDIYPTIINASSPWLRGFFIVGTVSSAAHKLKAKYLVFCGHDAI